MVLTTETNHACITMFLEAVIGPLNRKGPLATSTN
jgi:hypothetical protein